MGLLAVVPVYGYIGCIEYVESVFNFLADLFKVQGLCDGGKKLLFIGILF